MPASDQPKKRKPAGRKASPSKASSSSKAPSKDETSTSPYCSFVVHCQRSSYDVYIGRRNPKVKSDGRWGNPFKLGPDGDREAVIARYRAWLLGQPELVAQVKAELKGKTLGCWCSPLACHGDVLAEVANSDEGAG